MQCKVHFIITLFNVGNLLLRVIYQLNFNVFMYVTRISRYIERSVLSAVSRNRGKSWNVLPVDTGTLLSLSLYIYIFIIIIIIIIIITHINHYVVKEKI
jgi:hypothetical protein